MKKKGKNIENDNWKNNEKKKNTTKKKANNSVSFNCNFNLKVHSRTK